MYLTLKKTHSESPFERFYREQREKLENEEQSEKFHKHYEENAKSGDKYKKFSTANRADINLVAVVLHAIFEDLTIPIYAKIFLSKIQ